MTAYFDRAEEHIASMIKTFEVERVFSPSLAHDLKHREYHLVEDATFCAMTRGFSPHLRKKIHLCILDNAVHYRPVNRPDHPKIHLWENAAGALYAVEKLARELHTIFHEVSTFYASMKGSQRNLFGDSPLDPYKAQYARGERQRERMRWPNDPKLVKVEG